MQIVCKPGNAQFTVETWQTTEPNRAIAVLRVELGAMQAMWPDLRRFEIVERVSSNLEESK